MTDESRIAALNEQYGVNKVVRVSAGNGGLPKISIESEAASADVYLYGAQVTSWRPAGFDEVLFLSEKSHWEEGKAIRGGIPVCFPWFRGKPDNDHAPTHGFVRTKEWTIDTIRVEANEEVVVVLSTQSDAETRRWWPHEFRLEYAIRVGQKLMLELMMRNTGDSGLQFQEALHTYFKVGDVEQVSVQGLDGNQYLDNRDGNRENRQEGNLTLTKQTDNAYLDAIGTVEILDPVIGRRLVTEKQNSVSTIVWNPWSDGAAALSDFGDEEWHAMLCVEGGNVLGQKVELKAEETQTLKISLGASRL
jgi:glucose-6-phosphate 1-epimerase